MEGWTPLSLQAENLHAIVQNINFYEAYHTPTSISHTEF